MLSANVLVFAAPQKTIKSEPQSSMFMHESAHETVSKLLTSSVPFTLFLMIESVLRTVVVLTLRDEQARSSAKSEKSVSKKMYREQRSG